MQLNVSTSVIGDSRFHLSHGANVQASKGALVDGANSEVGRTVTISGSAASTERFNFLSNAGFTFSSGYAGNDSVIVAVCFGSLVRTDLPVLLRLPAVCDYCASYPCQSGGQCFTTPSDGFACQCFGRTGPLCQFDLDACAIDNGGCGIGPCFNLVDGPLCAPYFLNESLSAFDAISYAPLVLSSTQPGNKLTFQIVPLTLSPQSDVIALEIGVGTVSQPFMYPCTDVTAIAPFDLANQTITCTLAAGCGTNMHVSLRLSTYPQFPLLSNTSDVVSFPPPTLIGNSLRSNKTNVARTTDLRPGTVLSVQIEFDGTNFCPAEPNRTSVYYGPASNPTLRQCTIVASDSSYTTISCTTTAGSSGIGNHLTLTVAGQSVVSTDTITFPVVPVILRASGCVDVGNTTTRCSTEGGEVLTLFGENFVNPIQALSIGGVSCNSITASTDSNTRVQCVVPPGTGTDRAISITATGNPSEGGPALSYDIPIITNLTSPNCTSTGFASLENCPAHGGATITVGGFNFGARQARVLIGSTWCLEPVHGTSPHRSITCTLAAGTAASLGVLVFQVYNARAIISSHQYRNAFFSLFGTVACVVISRTAVIWVEAPLFHILSVRRDIKLIQTTSTDVCRVKPDRFQTCSVAAPALDVYPANTVVQPRALFVLTARQVKVANINPPPARAVRLANSVRLPALAHARAAPPVRTVTRPVDLTACRALPVQRKAETVVHRVRCALRDDFRSPLNRRVLLVMEVRCSLVRVSRRVLPARLRVSRHWIIHSAIVGLDSTAQQRMN